MSPIRARLVSMSAAGAADLTGSRGRIDKRQAILDAAFAVFAREGYVQAGVDAIAAEAGVAKATVYNHFGDKETVLRQTVALLAEQALAQNLAAVERLTDTGGDLRELLEDVGLSLAHCYCDERSWTLRRLLLAEFGRFPDLIGVVYGQVNDRVIEALADRLARLALAAACASPTRSPPPSSSRPCWGRRSTSAPSWAPGTSPTRRSAPSPWGPSTRSSRPSRRPERPVAGQVGLPAGPDRHGGAAVEDVAGQGQAARTATSAQRPVQPDRV